MRSSHCHQGFQIQWSNCIRLKDTFQIHEEFTLHYLDEDFGDFFTIHSTKEVKHKGTIKVVVLPSIVLTIATPETENVTDVSDVSDTSSFISKTVPSQSSSSSVDYQSRHQCHHISSHIVEP